MASVMQGDAYNIPVTIKSGNGTLITPEIAACVEITVGQFTKRWPGQVTFDEKTGEWQFPVTQKQTFRFLPGTAVVQARVVFQDGSIMGGSGAPVRVEQSASRGTLPQPGKMEAGTGSAPKATEVMIPTVHDIDVSLHSQVILSDPIKAPYIGDNGNWYEYDAATGEFVDTGVKAGGGADPSLGITGAQVGQIAKITAVDTDGKPTAWEAVEMPTGGGGGETWEKIAEIDFDVDAANDVSVWEYNNLPNYKEIAYRKVGLVGSTETASGLSISINDGLSNFSVIQYAKKGGQSNGWGKILLLPFGWIHVNSGSANSPTNYAYGGLQTIYNAIPFDGDSITSVKLFGNPIYKIAGGKLSLYGRR